MHFEPETADSMQAKYSQKHVFTLGQHNEKKNDILYTYFYILVTKFFNIFTFGKEKKRQKKTLWKSTIEATE